MSDSTSILTRDLFDSRLEGIFEAILDELQDIVAIPSVSSDPVHAADLEVSTLHMRSRFITTGLNAKTLRVTTPEGIEGKPAAVVRTKKIEGAPTVLLYAHHDVQPCGDASRWSSDPFVAEVRGDRIYERGISDDGAGIAVHLGALRLLGNELPVNVVVFVEDEEELGSPSFTTSFQTYKEELQADVIVVCGSDDWKAGEPAATSPLRGNSVATVDMAIADHAVHSGMFGDPIFDPVTCASMLIASMYDEKGDLVIPGLSGTLEADVEWSEEEFRAVTGLLEGVELVGTGDLAARVWTKPSVSVIGFDARPVSEASNTIAPHTHSKFSIRVVPGVDPHEAMDRLVEFLEPHAPFGAKVEIIPSEFGPGYQTDMNSALTGLLHEVLSEAWGAPSMSIGVGDSIPFISNFQCLFPDAEVVVTGVEDPLTNAHSEDESQCISDLRTAILAEVVLLIRLASQ